MRTPRRMARAFVVVAMIASGLAMLPATPAFALANNPDTTWMTNGSVWATAQYGNVLFIGGSFTQVRSVPVGTTGGTIIAANNLAAIDMTTGQGIASFHPNVADPACRPLRCTRSRSWGTRCTWVGSSARSTAPLTTTSARSRSIPPR